MGNGQRAGRAIADYAYSALSPRGGALGIALCGSIGVAMYRMAMASRIPPSLPAGEAEAARSTLGGAVAAAGQLPADQAQLLIDAGRNAFLSALRLCAAISVAGSLVLAVCVALTLPRAKPQSA